MGVPYSAALAKEAWDGGNYLGAIIEVAGMLPLGKAFKPFKACNSFSPDTPVLMADGTAKGIKDVAVGDLVLATDPETGLTAAREVTRLIVGEGDKVLTEVSIDTSDGIKSILATANHPFWVTGQNLWINASDLQPGKSVLTPTGATATVVAVRIFEQKLTVYNLTVANIHTYYVLAGNTPVLVHNEGGGQIDLKGKSYTVWQRGPYRIDIEGAPGGLQMHFQEQINGVPSSKAPKYQYNFETGEFDGMPNSLKKELKKNYPDFQKGVKKAIGVFDNATC